MSRAHIDNEDHVFQFDPYEPLVSALDRLEVSARRERTHHYTVHLPTSSLDSTPSLSGHRSSDAMQLIDPKGKAVLYEDDAWGLHESAAGAEQDVFAFAVGSSSSAAQLYAPLSELDPAYTPADSVDPEVAQALFEIDDIDDLEDNGARGTGNKGKAREQPPTLPPLSFFTEFNYQSVEWPTFDSSSPPLAGPSSYGSLNTSLGSPARSQASSAGTRTSARAGSPEQEAPVVRMPALRRTLSNASARSSRSLSGLSMSKMKVKLASKGPGNLARKLLLKRRAAGEEPDANAPLEASCFSPWARDLKTRTTAPTLDLDLALGAVDPLLSLYSADRPAPEYTYLRTKGRSYSSPLPLPATPLDLVPVVAADIFEPVRVRPRPRYFEERLPRELKLHILASLVRLHEAEHRRNVENGKWTALKSGATRNRWVGAARGVRELFKFSRVSKEWRELVFDGQLWAKLALRAFPQLPARALQQLCSTAGPFARELDLAGHASLQPETLLDITEALCTPSPVLGGLGRTQLTVLNLHGCTAVSTHALHHLLTRSPALTALNLRGLTAATNATCDILAVYCPKVVDLNLSYCSSLTADGIRRLAAAALARGERLPLRSFRLSCLKRVDDEMMAALGRACPDLEVLDLSYVRDLHNSAVEALVACTEDEARACDAVCLTAREAGRDPADPTRVWRRVTRLRHVSLAGCGMLTDHACSHLAHAVPRLELLELAGIGRELCDDGLVRLLGTTPHLRKLDLEDALEISDDVLFALTPEDAVDGTGKPPQTGLALEHLVISCANDVTNEAIQELVRACPRLRVLEADNTRLSGTSLRAFVENARRRELRGARIVAVDCRNVGEGTVKDLNGQTRPRLGWRGWEAKKLAFLDGRDAEGLDVGQDECDEARVVLKTFYSWQTVDAVRAAREKRRKARRVGSGEGSGVDEHAGAARTRWWSPSGRRSGLSSPAVLDLNNERDGCTIM